MSADVGSFLLGMGRVADAIEHLERARAEEPLFGLVAVVLGQAYEHEGDFVAALAEFDRGLRIGDAAPLLRGNAFWAALATGDRDEIHRRLEVPEGGDNGITFNARFAQFLDDREAGLAEVRRMLADESATASPVVVGSLALWAAYYGDPELALSVFRELAASGGSGLVRVNLWRSVLREMRKLPEFDTLVHEMGLVDYWREYGWSDFCRPAGADDFVCE